MKVKYASLPVLTTAVEILYQVEGCVVRYLRVVHDPTKRQTTENELKKITGIKDLQLIECVLALNKI